VTAGPPFPEAARRALADTQLRHNLGHATRRIRTKRAHVVSELPDWLREAGRALKERVLRHLDDYLLELEAAVAGAGGVVHWARDAEECNRVVGDVIASHGAAEVVKAKSLTTEETKLNEAPGERGIRASETDRAQLHWPLSEDSVERNGTPQRLVTHAKLPKQHIAIPALPDRGLHPRAARGLKRIYSGTPIDVLRYHNDDYPTGWNQSETDLTPASVASPSFGQLTTLNVDGNVIAQPLMVSNYKMPDGTTHNVLLVVTGHDTVYAYESPDYSVL